MTSKQKEVPRLPQQMRSRTKEQTFTEIRGVFDSLASLAQSDSCPKKDLNVAVWERQCHSKPFIRCTLPSRTEKTKRRLAQAACTLQVCAWVPSARTTHTFARWGVLLRSPPRWVKAGPLSNGQQSYFLSRVEGLPADGIPISIGIRGSRDTINKLKFRTELGGDDDN